MRRRWKCSRYANAQQVARELRPLAPIVTAAILVVSLASGCAVGPNYQRPAVQTPVAYRESGDTAQAQAQAKAASFADLPWWQVFQDPQLQELIRTALKQNYDLRIATERINASRAQVAVTRSALFPQVSGNGNFLGGKEGNFQSKFNFLSLTADATFQLDFFGRLRRATESARAQMLATEEAQRTVTLTVVSDVASAYFELLQLDLQLQITREHRRDAGRLRETDIAAAGSRCGDEARRTCRRSKYSIPRMRRSPISKGRLARWRTPSASSSGIIPALSRAD